jgi:hypothetical protein
MREAEHRTAAILAVVSRRVGSLEFAPVDPPRDEVGSYVWSGLFRHPGCPDRLKPGSPVGGKSLELSDSPLNRSELVLVFLVPAFAGPNSGRVGRGATGPAVHLVLTA